VTHWSDRQEAATPARREPEAAFGSLPEFAGARDQPTVLLSLEKYSSGRILSLAIYAA
jgi:hypothetical protein